ncbi:MAG: mechanosensitive ion channel, partial [Candidatus Omnitrophica bacterium]|nr:mechanosensitive ion channel [Candidatus Omnitrophota bacterium]
ATSIIVQYAFIIFGVVPLALCLVFLVAGRDIVASILAGRFLMKEYKEGERIEFDSISGEIESVGFLTTKIKSNADEILIPNSELAKKIIKKKV